MMDLIGFVVFGLVVGVVARLFVPGRQHLSLAMTAGLGMAGSVIGGFVASALGTGDMFELNIIGGIVAFASAVALVTIVDRAGALGGRSRD